MKKILLILLLTIFFIPSVKADTTIDLLEQDFYPLSSFSSCTEYSNLYYYSNFDTFISDTNNKSIFNTLYREIKDYIATNHSNSNYYLYVNLISSSSSFFSLHSVTVSAAVINDSFTYSYHNSYSTQDGYIGITSSNTACNKDIPIVVGSSLYLSPKDSNRYYTPLGRFESNYSSSIPVYDDLGYTTFNIYDSNNLLKATYSSGDNVPVFLDSTYDEYVPSIYTEVNLDSYEYAILSLKDYSKTEPFETNLLVKGMIGITPVYEFGTVEKENVTDRCNISYTDYTDYRFFVLKNDLVNNAVYYVKACEKNSSFRFDNTIFDITYVTTDTVDDPVVTVGGVSYNAIPFNKLSTTANSNEQNNFIPGQSGSSLTDIVDNTTKFTTDSWNAITSFMGLTTKFFNTLPEEFRHLSITAFTVLVIIAVIKFIRG